MGQRRVRWLTLAVLFWGFWLVGVEAASAEPLASQTTRIYGSNRVETAIETSRTGWEQADTVLLARADDFPDSLVAVPLAHQLDAPILLTSTKKLDAAVLAELERLGTKHVVILGGAGVMGEQISAPLEAAGLTWERIGGQNRYETSAMVADRVGGNGQAILVSGENFPDALAISPYAGVTETPILLTSSKGMPTATTLELEKLQAESWQNAGEGLSRILVIGGQGVIPDETLAGITGVERIAGQNRYETAAEVYWFSSSVFNGDGVGPGGTANRAYVVTGENFPDALVVGALAAKQGVPLFMSAGNSLPAYTYSAMSSMGNGEGTIALVGGEKVLSPEVQGTIEGTVQPSYLLAGKTIVVDPGHGGPDPGARGASGTTWEKNNNLAVGLELSSLLRSAGANVILTRTADVSPAGTDYSYGNSLPDLQARVDIANNAGADMYIGIHNDSFTSPTAGGTTTYYSTDNLQAASSQQLGQNIQQEVGAQLGLLNRGVKTSGVYVVKYTTMPAVLVELGFISNPTEEQMLSSPEYQKKAALGIYRGILSYVGY